MVKANAKTFLAMAAMFMLYGMSAAGLFMTFAVGGGAVPLTQGFVADHFGYMISYAVPAIGIAYLAAYALFLSRPVSREVA